MTPTHRIDPMTYKLMPCPFCGGQAELVEGEECAYVQCLDMKMHRAMFVDGDNTAGLEAAEQWNARSALAAAPQPAPVDREALVRIIAEADDKYEPWHGGTCAGAIADDLLARGLRLPDADAEAERDAAFAAGQAEMRGRAAEKCRWHSDQLVEGIRALPIKPRPE